MSYAGLVEAVGQLRYKKGWRFTLLSGPSMGTMAHQSDDLPVPTTGSAIRMIIPDDEVVTLVITLSTADSGDPEKTILVPHHFSMYGVSFRGDWERWIFQCVMAVETHEAREFFRVGSRQPFYPPHGSEGDPYAPW